MFDKEFFRNNFKYFDKHVVLESIDMLLSEYEERLAELQKNIHDLDFKAIDDNAHSIKGVVGWMSEGLYELARIVEFKGKESDSNGLQEAFNNLEQGTIELADALQEMRKEYLN
jgi:HPt (histidine-containing phosphotransfer) domain-containing protein